MHAELLEMAAGLAREGEPFVLALVVRRRPASSSRAGDMALITTDGTFHGWLGGSCTQPTVVREALAALADGQPRLVVLAPDPESERRPGVAVFPMTCHSGGTVEIYLEPILAPPRLVVFGVSPTAQALARLGKGMGYQVAVVDPALDPETAEAMFPSADQRLTSPKSLAPSQPARTATFAVVASLGERDEAAIRDALALNPDYLGVVASARRFAQVRETLLASGTPAAALDAIHSPAGIRLGGKAPAEIALSILAEIVQLRQTETPAAVPVPAPEATALDPICGMTVKVATARHLAEHAGTTYYFCCGGCREKFLATPERYLVATS